MSISNIPFWLVYDGDGYPNSKNTSFQSSLESAQNEAERLAKECPGKEFYVLMPVTKTVKSDVRIEWFIQYVVADLILSKE